MSRRIPTFNLGIVRRAACGGGWAMLLAMGLAPGRAGAQDVPTPAQSIAAGSRVYGTKGCGTCHAINGIGGAAGPDLAQLSARSAAGVVAALWNHLPQMADHLAESGLRPPRLDAWEAADLLAFLFWAGARAPRGSPEMGRELFTSRQCVLCHRVGDVGGVLAPPLDRAWVSGIDLAAGLWNHAPSMSAEMRARRIPRPSLTRQDIDDLVAFLSTTNPPHRPSRSTHSEATRNAGAPCSASAGASAVTAPVAKAARWVLISRPLHRGIPWHSPRPCGTKPRPWSAPWRRRA